MPQSTHVFISRERTGNQFDEKGDLTQAGEFLGPFKERITIPHLVSRVTVEFMLTAQLKSVRGTDPVFVERLVSPNLIPGVWQLGVCLSGSLGQRNVPLDFQLPSPTTINNEYEFGIVGPSGERDQAVTDTVIAIRLTFHEC